MTGFVDEPNRDLGDPKQLLLGFLDYYRSAVARKIDGLGEGDLRTSRLPSGWTPLELLKHLVYMEQRWVRWGFAAEQLREPWGDDGADGRWRVDPEETVTDLVAAAIQTNQKALAQQGASACGRARRTCCRRRPRRI